MPYQYTNRRGDVYFVQAKDRKGKTAYSATRKPAGDVLEKLPNGYELHELPDNAQVVIRKIKPSPILATELQAVETAVRTLAKVEHFIVDVADRSLVVYLMDGEPDGSLSILQAFAPMSATEVESHKTWMIRRANYDKMMRFTLDDPERRVFSVQRWCFRGSIDGWIDLGGGSLQELVEKYVPHLGKESFYDLMRSF